MDLESTGPAPAPLPSPDRERAEAFLRSEVRVRWEAARWGLRAVLGRYLGEQPEAVELDAGEHGKPRLARDPERLSFNLSHSGSLALVAVAAGREVGVDVERVVPRRDVLALAERALEAAAVASVREARADERSAVFYARWVEHEARLKCLGTGIGAADQAQQEPVALQRLDVGPGYAAAVAVAGEGVPPCRCYALAAPEGA